MGSPLPAASPAKLRLPNTPFVVDGFCTPSSGVTTFQPLFFLTHAHKDHVSGLRKDWNAGKLYCSAVTRALILHEFGLAPDVVVRLVPARSRIHAIAEAPGCVIARLGTDCAAAGHAKHRVP